MRTIRLLLGILFSIAVAACGGGGGYGSGSPGGSPAGGYNISGMVSGGATNNSGVTIKLSGSATQTMTTAAGGSYSFAGLANGSYTVTPTLSGYTFTPASSTVSVSYNNFSSINFMESP